MSSNVRSPTLAKRHTWELTNQFFPRYNNRTSEEQNQKINTDTNLYVVEPEILSRTIMWRVHLSFSNSTSLSVSEKWEHSSKMHHQCSPKVPFQTQPEIYWIFDVQLLVLHHRKKTIHTKLIAGKKNICQRTNIWKTITPAPNPSSYLPLAMESCVWGRARLRKPSSEMPMLNSPRSALLMESSWIHNPEKMRVYSGLFNLVVGLQHVTDLHILKSRSFREISKNINHLCNVSPRISLTSLTTLIFKMEWQNQKILESSLGLCSSKIWNHNT